MSRQFGLIILPSVGFFDLINTEAQKQTLNTIHRHLRPKGRLIMDLLMPSDRVFGGSLSDHNDGSQMRLVARLVDSATRRVHLIWEAAHHVPNDQYYEINRLIQTFDDTGQAVEAARHFQIKGRYVHRFEMQHLLDLCGFEVVTIYGGFNYEPFSPASKRIVWVVTPKR